MSDEQEIVTVNIYDWVEKAKSDPVRYLERQATEVILTAIGLTDKFSNHIFLKGGILMAVLYDSPRNTGDIDFTTDLNPADAEGLPKALREALDSALPRAAAELGYPDFLSKVQSLKIRPKKDSLANDTFPAMFIKVGYAKRESPQEKGFKRGESTTVVQMDISFNEPVSGIQIVRLNADQAVTIKAYSLNDLIAEKLRALLQQPSKMKNRRQDIYDIDLLIKRFVFDESERDALLKAVLVKCKSRGIFPNEDALSHPDVRERAQAEWGTLALEIGDENLSDFDECFDRVDRFYRSLPWL